MRLRGLAIFPFVFAAAFIAITLTLEGPARTQFVIGQKLLVRILAIVGCVAAARAFQAGDRLRQAWLWFAFSTAIFLSRDLMRLTDHFGPQGPGANSWYFSASVLLGKSGFERVANLAGGMLRWRAQSLPVENGAG